MLDKLETSVVNHPFFHNLDYDSASELLEEVTEGNCLFCNDENGGLLLVFRGEDQDGVVQIVHDTSHNEFVLKHENDDVVYYKSLYNIVKDLPTILSLPPATDIKPLSKISLLVKNLHLDLFPRSPIPNEIAKQIVSSLDSTALKNLALTSKSGALFFNEERLARMEKNWKAAQENRVKKIKQIRYIYKTISEILMSPAIGTPILYRTFSHMGFEISNLGIDPYYMDELLEPIDDKPSDVYATLTTPSSTFQIIIRENSLENIFCRISPSLSDVRELSDKELDGLEQLCIHVDKASNPEQDIPEKEEKRSFSC